MTNSLYDGIKIDDIDYFNISNMVSDIIVKLISKRIELKMSQRQLAEKTGIKQPMIARIEKFESIPRLDTLIRMANALGLIVTFANDSNNYESMSLNVNNTYFDKIQNRSENQNHVLCEDVNDSLYNGKK